MTTEPVGPTYKAGTLYTVTCNASNAFQPYTLEWSLGCTYTNTFSSYVTTEAHTIGFYATTSKTCENIYRCRVTDSFSTIAIGQVIIETITGKVYIIVTMYSLGLSILSCYLHS